MVCSICSLLCQFFLVYIFNINFSFFLLISLICRERILEDFFKNPVLPMVSIKVKTLKYIDFASTVTFIMVPHRS